jgi:hypothetical protein
LLKQAVAIVLFCAFLPAQTAGPERKVESNVITSERDPAVRIRVPNSAQYVGADRWVLYGMADCELHAFVYADAQKSVQRLYWVQFEGYLPTRPELKYTYDSPRHANIGGMDFYVDTWLRTKDADATGFRCRAHRSSNSHAGLPHAGGNDVRASRASP